MAYVLAINCPSTGKPLSTGIAVRDRDFNRDVFKANTIGPCPHCGDSHTWDGKDAFVVEVKDKK